MVCALGIWVAEKGSLVLRTEFEQKVLWYQAYNGKKGISFLLKLIWEESLSFKGHMKSKKGSSYAWKTQTDNLACARHVNIKKVLSRLEIQFQLKKPGLNMAYNTEKDHHMLESSV